METCELEREGKMDYREQIDALEVHSANDEGQMATLGEARGMHAHPYLSGVFSKSSAKSFDPI